MKNCKKTYLEPNNTDSDEQDTKNLKFSSANNHMEDTGIFDGNLDKSLDEVTAQLNDSNLHGLNELTDEHQSDDNGELDNFSTEMDSDYDDDRKLINDENSEP